MRLIERTTWETGEVEEKSFELRNWKDIRYYVKGKEDWYVDVQKKALVKGRRDKAYEIGKKYECRGPRKTYYLEYILLA